MPYVLPPADNFGHSALYCQWRYYCLVPRLFNKQQFTAIPFLGGSLGALGLYINPLVDPGYFVYLPFFIDYFSLPFHLVLLGKCLIRLINGPVNSRKRP